MSAETELRDLRSVTLPAMRLANAALVGQVVQLLDLLDQVCDYAESATLEDDPLPACVIDAQILVKEIRDGKT